MPTTTTTATQRSTGGSSAVRRSMCSAHTRGSPTRRAVLPVRPPTKPLRLATAWLLCLALGSCGAGSDRPTTVAPPGVAAPTTSVAAGASVDQATGILRTTKFAAPPVLLYTLIEGTGGGYTVYARLTRELPRDRRGGISAAFNITSDPAAVQGNPILTRRGHRRHCYEQAISYLATQPTPTRRGARVELTLTAHDRQHHHGTLRTTVRLATRTVRGNVPEGSYPKRVGC